MQQSPPDTTFSHSPWRPLMQANDGCSHDGGGDWRIRCSILPEGGHTRRGDSMSRGARRDERTPNVCLSLGGNGRVDEWGDGAHPQADEPVVQARLRSIPAYLSGGYGIAEVP